MAVDVLRARGVPEDHILFLNLIASPEGATSFAKKYPKVRIVTAFVDQGLNDKKYTPSRSLTQRGDPTDKQLQLHRTWTRRLW